MLLTAVLAGGSVVDLDATVIFQLICFLILLIVLRPLLFKPLLAVLVARERGTEGDVKEAKKREADAEEKMRKYEKELQRIKEKASTEREKIRESGREREREILEKARQEATKMVEDGRGKMQSQADAVRKEMDQEIEILSKEIAAAVLGRKAA